MAVRSVNSLTHYTDWTVAHVHAGAIGWVAMITIGSLYAMAPRALDRPAMHSQARHEPALLAARLGPAHLLALDVGRGRHAKG